MRIGLIYYAKDLIDKIFFAPAGRYTNTWNFLSELLKPRKPTGKPNSSHSCPVRAYGYKSKFA